MARDNFLRASEMFSMESYNNTLSMIYLEEFVCNSILPPKD